MYHFAETEEDHARRLGQSRRFTRIRRRALLRKLEGQSPEQIRREMGESNCPYDVADASLQELMDALGVVLDGDVLRPSDESPPRPLLTRVEERRRGDRRDRGRLYPGKHPAIVTWDEFVAAQDTRVRLATKNPDALWECPWEGAPEEE